MNLKSDIQKSVGKSSKDRSNYLILIQWVTSTLYRSHESPFVLVCWRGGYLTTSRTGASSLYEVNASSWAVYKTIHMQYDVFISTHLGSLIVEESSTAKSLDYSYVSTSSVPWLQNALSEHSTTTQTDTLQLLTLTQQHNFRIFTVNELFRVLVLIFTSWRVPKFSYISIQ